MDYTGNDKTELDQKLNEGILDILRRTRCYQTFGTEALVAGTWQYTMDTTALTMIKVYTTSGSSSSQMEQVTPAELIDLQTSSTLQSSPVSRYAIAGASTLLVYPTPASADTLNLLYVPRPTAMSAAGNDPSTATYGGIPAEWHYGIELYALWKMADSTDDASSAQGERYRTMYEGDDGRGGFLRQIRAEINRKGGGPRRARVNAFRNASIAVTPSTDIY